MKTVLSSIIAGGSEDIASTQKANRKVSTSGNIKRCSLSSPSGVKWPSNLPKVVRFMSCLTTLLLIYDMKLTNVDNASNYPRPHLGQQT
jgi:hypothetical protein